MKYGDFSTLVQLGVGLHVGTALLQLYGELGVQPLLRTIARTRSLFAEANEGERPPNDIKEELDDIEMEYEIFKIKLFNEYKKYVKINSSVAVFLIFILTTLSYIHGHVVSDERTWITVVIVSFSILPAPITLGVLWVEAARQVKPMKERADALEKRALSSGKSGSGS